MRPALLIFGLALILMGLAAIPSVAWVGWLDVAIGAVAVAERFALQRAAPRVIRWAVAPLGLSLFAIWVLNLALSATTWPAWWNLAFGVGMLAASSSSPFMDFRETREAGSRGAHR